MTPQTFKKAKVIIDKIALINHRINTVGNAKQISISGNPVEGFIGIEKIKQIAIGNLKQQLSKLETELRYLN